MGAHPQGEIIGLFCCPQGQRSRLQTRGAGAPSCESWRRSSRNATSVSCPVTQHGASRQAVPTVFLPRGHLAEKVQAVPERRANVDVLRRVTTWKQDRESLLVAIALLEPKETQQMTA